MKLVSLRDKINLRMLKIKFWKS